MRHAGIPVGVHVLLERDGRVLLMRRAGTGFFDGLYSLPGDNTRAVIDGILLAGSVASLVGVGLLLFRASGASSGPPWEAKRL